MEWWKSYLSGNTAVHVRFREPRMNVRLAVYYGRTSRTAMTDFSVNVSSGGIFIETDLILPVDTDLFVEFTLPVNDRRIRCRSRVAWTNEPENRKSAVLPSGMGLQFLDLPFDDMTVIRNYIEEVGLRPAW